MRELNKNMIENKRYTSEKIANMHPHSVKNLRPECSTDAPCFLNAVYQNSTQMKKAQADTPQYGRLLPIDELQSGRSLRPECETDTQLFLSDVYNKRYMNEKITSRCPQYGRSMIEMLGVLTIIGILTVGGAELVKKAYDAYDVNLVINEISEFTPRARRFARDYVKEGSEVDITDKIYEAKSFPSNFKYDNSSTAFFGQTNAKYKVFYPEGNILYYLQIEDLSSAACMEIATTNWGSQSTSGFMGISVNYTGNNYDEVGTVLASELENPTITDKTGIVGNTAHPAPMSIGTATNACVNGNSNKISMAFR